MKIRKEGAKTAKGNVVHVYTRSGFDKLKASGEKWDYVRKMAGKGDWITLQEFGHREYYLILEGRSDDARLEQIRGYGSTVQAELNKAGATSFSVYSHDAGREAVQAFIEGAALGNYQFLKYRTNKSDLKNSLQTIYLHDPEWSEKEVQELEGLIHAVYLSRDLINEPVSYLSAVQFSKEMQKAGKSAGFTVKVLDKKAIQQHKMGGLLAVNAGSIDPPTFTIMEYKPAKAKNKKPIVLVGKGVVFDTGGLSLKPTPQSMDEMKCDMSGAAAVVGVMSAAAANKLPLHIVGLVPATDNRPGMNAVCPQDVITISDGTTVEVLNTDAEGRLILADALVYAARYKPELVIDLATLTGAAIRAIGSYASAVMGTADDAEFDSLEKSAFRTWERVLRFPLWKDYGDEMKSEVADLKNLGGANAGHISAGKFLEHFTSYPWIHIDIAGPAWTNSNSSYKPKGGTGVGVRMLYDFLKMRGR